MLTKYLNNSDYDLENSFVIGDRITDVELAKNLGSKAIFIKNEANLGGNEIATSLEELQNVIALQTTDWQKIYEFLKLEERKASISRKTNETDIVITLNLDGTGKSNIYTGISFFDHMLDQIARHGQMDLDIQVKGDLENKWAPGSQWYRATMSTGEVVVVSGIGFAKGTDYVP